MSNISAIISGTGSYVPEKRLTNDELSKLVDTNDEWIVQRTGIRERRIAGSHESTATLASHAATRALQAAGLEPKHLDLILCGTITPEMSFPSTACFVAASLGLDSTPAFDISAACSGFIYTLDTAAAYVKSGKYKTVLVVGSETLSRVTDYQDRGSCILFGDGAGAVIVQRSSELGRGLLYSSLHADGHGWEMLHCMPGSKHPVSEAMVAGRQQFMKIKGRDVYKFAVQRFHELIEDAMRKCELTAEKIKLIIPHQVNQRIIDSAMEKLNLPPEKAYVNIDRYGNTSAASIPIALDEAVRAGKLVKGDIVVFVAFGAGLTWANAVVKMQPMSQKTYILCPGQGAQAVGMGKDFFEAFPVARATFEKANQILGFDLASICFNGPEDRLNQTDIAQPAIYVTSIASYAAAKEAGMIHPEEVTAYAGLSLGEYTALHLGGVFSFEDGLKLVAARGKYMQEAAAVTPSGMVSLMGADEAAATKLCEENAKGEVLVPANFNSPGQIVVSGAMAACDRIAKAADAAGFKAIPLKVAGAFHSPLMKSGADRMAAELEKVAFNPPRTIVYANVTAQAHADAASTRRLLVDQIVKLVRWEQTMQHLVAQGDAKWIELAPGRVLTGLLKKINRRVPVETLSTADAITKAVKP